jgi:hypothetical protein
MSTILTVLLFYSLLPVHAANPPFTVLGAGTPGVNGTYNVSGTLNGNAQYSQIMSI